MGDGCERRQQQQQQRRRYVFSIMRTFAYRPGDLSGSGTTQQAACRLELRKGEVGVEWPCLRCVDESINVMDRSTR